jgi:hypothetical protein
VKLTASQIYQAARRAGFSATQAVTATAVALAESGGDPANLGDTGITTATWGPSVGLWQVRTDKRETGTGRSRDIGALTGDVEAQARAAYSISGGGSDWQPWTVFNTGAYQAYLGQAAAAAGSAGAGGTTTAVDWQDYLPWNAPGAAAGAVQDYIGGLLSDSVKPARKILITLVVTGLGLALVGVGLGRALSPQIAKAQAKVDQAKDIAGDVAMMVV